MIMNGEELGVGRGLLEDNLICKYSCVLLYIMCKTFNTFHLQLLFQL
jgi:hypothetical protein